MRRLRTFVAIELAGAVKKRARQLVDRLRITDSTITWVQPDNMHLTLKFLGDVPEIETPDVCRVVANAAASIEPFEIIFRGSGAFPSAENPRTLWLGVEEGREELIELQAAIEEGLHRDLGFAKEGRRFQPHLTIGRVKHVDPAEAERVTELLRANADFDGDLSVVDEVVTFASFLGREGPTYNALNHAPLSG
jgi:2'-5' RNA ligase